MEDYSSINAMGKLASSSSNERTTVVLDDDNLEESGWTTYLDDFFAKNNNNNSIGGDDQNRSSSFFSFDDHETAAAASSPVSDAASLILKKSDDDHLEENGSPIDNRSNYGGLSLKKRKTKGALVDDSLEDTASSPVNSPKVYDSMNQFDKNTKQRNMNILQDKANMASNQVVDERSDLGFVGKESDITELKKRGLCLVPLSFAVNYFG